MKNLTDFRKTTVETGMDPRLQENLTFYKEH